VLALIVERTVGMPFHEFVVERICEPAGMADTAFLRSDELPRSTATGYLSTDGPRTNVFHLPVRGSGDGGIYTTVADMRSFWHALFAGRIVSTGPLGELIRPRSDLPQSGRRYGHGFWIDAATGAVFLEGSDAGVSFRTVHDPARALTWTVVSNTTDGAWPIARLLAERL
jgi:CubicO group peptidase (beta-lactamase class C family)